MSIKITRRTNSDRQKFFNGTIKEGFNALVTSDGATVTFSIEKEGGGDLTLQFSDGLTLFDTTPAVTITLTAGADNSATENFIYILQSNKILTKSTSDWPTTEHIRLGYFLVPSAGFVQTNGVYINQNWNEELDDPSNNMGDLAHISEKLRRLNASYFSGVDGNGTDGYLTPTGGNTELKSTSGIVYQKHKQTYPAVDTSTGDVVLVKNWSGDSFHDLTNLYDIVADSTGTTIGNNKFFNLIIWGAVNKSGEYSPMMINLPSGFYNTQSSAESDVSSFDDFTIPREFNRESSTGFLIARITIQMKTGGGTWVVSSTTDLRGQTPTSATGGVSSIVTEFADNTFKIFDETDNTKELAFDVGTNVGTGNTVTLSAPTSSGSIFLTDGSQAMSGNLDMGTNNITNSPTIADHPHPDMNTTASPEFVQVGTDILQSLDDPNGSISSAIGTWTIKANNVGLAEFDGTSTGLISFLATVNMRANNLTNVEIFDCADLTCDDADVVGNLRVGAGVGGYTNSNNSIVGGTARTGGITANNSSIAWGDINFGDIKASGKGSLAIGFVSGGDIKATADNSWQFGVGTNSTANSLQVGTGVLLEANGDVTATGNLFIGVKSGATQVGAGAAVNEVWKTASHATLPDNVLLIGV